VKISGASAEAPRDLQKRAERAVKDLDERRQQIIARSRNRRERRSRSGLNIPTRDEVEKLEAYGAAREALDDVGQQGGLSARNTLRGGAPQSHAPRLAHRQGEMFP
jgi:hypothetical protein